MKTIILVGFGERGHIYAGELLRHKDGVKIAGVVEPDEYRRNEAKKWCDIPEENCFSSVEECVKLGKIADAVVNATMDTLHLKTAIPFLELGYDMLIEKPVANNRDDLMQIVNCAKTHGDKLSICFVLRYTDFYRKIKEILSSGEIGKIISIETNEYVAICHASHSFIRGKWNNREKCGSSMLLQKCSHDLDLICWLNNSTVPERVTSMGGRYFFVPENAPKNSGTRCLTDCPIEKECIYSARKLSLEHDDFPMLAWDCFDKNPSEVTPKEREESLKTDNVHGKCIFKTDANVVDRQMVTLQFKDGSVASHGMIVGVAKAGRDIHIVGSLGEIQGFLEDNKFVVRKYNPVTLKYDERTVDLVLSADVGLHSGGDRGLVNDFIDLINAPSGDSSVIEESVYGHLAVYCADESLEKGGEPVEIKL